MSSMGLQRGPARASEQVFVQEGLPQTGRLVGRSVAIIRVLEQIKRSVLHLRGGVIEGESGTGKTLVATELHARGPAAAGPMITLHSSLFDPANSVAGGMLLLEHLDEMPANQQAMLLDFLRGRDSSAAEPSLLPFQVVISSTVPLRVLVSAGALLPDLAYRLTAVRFYLPPLRERHEDIPVLAQYFIEHFATKYAKPMQGLASGTLSRLFSHAWPGNVRELRCVIESAVLQTEGQWIRPLDIVLLPPVSVYAPLASASASLQSDMSLDTAARNHVSAVMDYAGGNKKRAAALLGISRSTLYRMLERV